MRTTMTLEPDVAERLRQEMRKRGLGMKAMVNDALRIGLGLGTRTARESEPFRVDAHDFGFREGVDRDRLNQLVDELTVEDFARKRQP